MVLEWSEWLRCTGAGGAGAGICAAQALPKNALVFEVDGGVLDVVWGSVVLAVRSRGGETIGEGNGETLFRR